MYLHARLSSCPDACPCPSSGGFQVLPHYLLLKIVQPFKVGIPHLACTLYRCSYVST